MLTKEAFNALLKTLEEPPAHVKFMFATTEAEKILPTILSRCQRFDLRRIPAALIVEHLGAIARQENVRIDDAALHAIARGADGGMRDAESTLDQLISFCGSEIAEADVLSMFGLAARGQILALTDAILSAETEKALRQLNDLANQGKDLSRLVSELLAHFRNLLIFQVSRGDLTLVEASESEAVALREQSSRLNSDALQRMLEVLTDCEGRLRDATSRKILLEVTVLKMIEARNAVSIDTVLKQVQQLRAEAAGGAPRKPVGSGPAPAAAAKPAPMAAAAVAPASSGPASAPAPAAHTTNLTELWAQLVEAVGRASPFVRTYFVEAHPVSFAKNVLMIGFDPEFAEHLPLVDNSKNHALVQTKLAELGHPHAQVKFVKAEDPDREARSAAAAAAAPPAPSKAPAPTRPILSEASASSAPAAEDAPAKAASAQASAPFNREEFKNDPLIRKALEVFKGQIVDVRS
jgi:DNA polymerase-3 subunit gamma/tau